MRSPCMDCPDRSAGCHDSCERFREYRVKVEEIGRKTREESAANLWRFEAEMRILKHRHLHMKGRK